MNNILIKINRFFAFTRKDRCGIYVLLFLIAATIALRTLYPFWETGTREFSGADTVAAAAVANKAAFSGGYNGGGNSGYNSVYNGSETAQQFARKEQSDSSAAGNSRPAYTPPAYMQKKQFYAALNSADTNDLKELRGIGSGFARRIVAYREKLGGFVRKEQLREIWGIDSMLYALVSPQVTIDATNIRKININAVPLDILKKHPYLDYYLAKEIVKYREKYGAFAATGDLRRVNLIDEETYNRIKPYLTVE
jgi:DNA uptake protein ComE-like DNA-binding protein